MRTINAIRKMIELIDRTVSFCENVQYGEFAGDTVLTYACSFSVSQIGELVSRVDDSVIAAHSEIPFRPMKGLRNLIVHDYDNIDPKILWSVIVKELPALRIQLQNLLDALQAEEISPKE